MLFIMNQMVEGLLVNFFLFMMTILRSCKKSDCCCSEMYNDLKQTETRNILKEKKIYKN